MMGKRKTGPLKPEDEEFDASRDAGNAKKKRSGVVTDMDLTDLQEISRKRENDVQDIRNQLEKLRGNKTTLYGNTEAKILNNRLLKCQTAYAEVQRELVKRQKDWETSNEVAASAASSALTAQAQAAAQSQTQFVNFNQIVNFNQPLAGSAQAPSQFISFSPPPAALASAQSQTVHSSQPPAALPQTQSQFVNLSQSPAALPSAQAEFVNFGQLPAALAPAQAQFVSFSQPLGSVLSPGLPATLPGASSDIPAGLIAPAVSSSLPAAFQRLPLAFSSGVGPPPPPPLGLAGFAGFAGFPVLPGSAVPTLGTGVSMPFAGMHLAPMSFPQL